MAAGAALLYLPPYSLYLNPIEQLFAKLKALSRKAAARTQDDLWQAIGRLLAAVPQANENALTNRADEVRHLFAWHRPSLGQRLAHQPCARTRSAKSGVRRIVRSGDGLLTDGVIMIRADLHP